MFIFLLVCLFLVIVLLEGTTVSVPLSFIALLLLTIYKRDSFVFFPAFFSGIFLDVLLLRPIGATSLYFLIFCFLILLYQRKYEIRSYPFVIVSSFIGSYFYLLILNGSAALGLSIISSIVALSLFLGFSTSSFRSKK